MWDVNHESALWDHRGEPTLMRWLVDKSSKSSLNKRTGKSNHIGMDQCLWRFHCSIYHQIFNFAQVMCIGDVRGQISGEDGGRCKADKVAMLHLPWNFHPVGQMLTFKESVTLEKCVCMCAFPSSKCLYMCIPLFVCLCLPVHTCDIVNTLLTRVSNCNSRQTNVCMLLTTPLIGQPSALSTVGFISLPVFPDGFLAVWVPQFSRGS